MAEFRIKIREAVVYEINVEAPTAKEALAFARDQFADHPKGKIVSDRSDFLEAKVLSAHLIERLT